MPSKIIKGEDVGDVAERAAPRGARPGVVDSEVYDAHQKARDIVEQAERQATAILEKAQQERDATVAAAKEQGRQEGLAQATGILVKAREEHARLLAGAEHDMVKLSLVVAERLIGRSLETDPSLVLYITAQAIESVRGQRELVLRVNPQDGEFLRSNRKKLMDVIGRTKDIAVKDDPEVERGGCVVETEHGTVDAQLKTQLQVLEEALLKG